MQHTKKLAIPLLPTAKTAAKVVNLKPLKPQTPAKPAQVKRLAPCKKIVAEEIELTAQQKLTLRCGDTLISLDAEGTVNIQGLNVVNQALVNNIIIGATIRLN